MATYTPRPLPVWQPPMAGPPPPPRITPAEFAQMLNGHASEACLAEVWLRPRPRLVYRNWAPLIVDARRQEAA